MNDNNIYDITENEELSRVDVYDIFDTKQNVKNNLLCIRDIIKSNDENKIEYIGEIIGTYLNLGVDNSLLRVVKDSLLMDDDNDSYPYNIKIDLYDDSTKYINSFIIFIKNDELSIQCLISDDSNEIIKNVTKYIAMKLMELISMYPFGLIL